MRKEIAIILPTYKRADKLKGIIKNYKQTSKFSNLYFVITPDDKESRKILKKLKQKYFVVDLEYTQSVNYAVKRTKEPFVLCAADDIEFMPNWEKELLKLTKDKTKHIFGGIDSWRVSKTMAQISHPLVRRAYVEKQEDGNLYYRDYIHYMNDIELIQRGLKEGCVSIVPKVLIEHRHPLIEGVKEKDWDETYHRSSEVKEHDFAVFNRRKAEFEMYDTSLFNENGPCYLVPTKLNPLYNKTLVSIVIPTYNDADFLVQCLESVAANTYYRYEVIIVDDVSDELQKTKNHANYIKTKELFDSFEFADKSCEIRVFYNKKRQWINYGWEFGSRKAKGNYIAIINSDITLSKDWDKFLVGALELPERKFAISCPYEMTPYVKKPYSLIPLFKKHCPHMIKGPCFMFRKTDVPKLFPIPKSIKHWCGDNVIADKVATKGGVVFTSSAQIFHYVTQSGKRLDKSVYTNRICADVLAYERWSGKNMDYIKNNLPFNTYYSQYGEDKWIDENLKLPKKGFYVDVGASHPTYASNTKFLEDKGWKGICIDADPSTIPALKKDRKAKVIQAVISDKRGKAILNISKFSALTSLNKLQKIGEVKEVKVKTVPLKDITSKHIDFLSIDVEGAELKVCDGINWQDPPDVIMLEHKTMHEPSIENEIIKYFSKLPYELVYSNDVNLVFKRLKDS